MKNLSEELQTYKENPGELYSRGFFQDILKAKRWQLPLGKKIAELYGFESVIDFGCASGYYLEGILEGGCKNILGLEYLFDNSKEFISEHMVDYIKYGNAMEEIDCGKFECVMSIEVAEHLLPEKSDIFVDNLTRASDKYILFTEALPGQGGVGHINERPSSFWINMFSERGFIYSPQETNRIKTLFNLLGKKSSAFRQGLNCLTKH